MTTCKITMRNRPTTVRQLMSGKALAGAVLDIVRMTKAGRCPQEREKEEEEADRDERQGMNEEKMEGDDDGGVRE